MDEVLRHQFGEDDWPDEAERLYERVEVLGRGSFGVVWMARRISKGESDDSDEYVAIKNIEIKEAKSRVYAQREISILSELKHPNVIRLIRAFPVYQNRCQLVAMQMARGPNLQYLVTKRGALGLPLARLVTRHLIAAVSYLHGRAVLHRDIKPTNCILENTELRPQDLYDWVGDDMIWSDEEEAARIVATGKYKLMLVDFGFARALEEDQIKAQKRKMRGSIVNEHLSINEVAKIITDQFGDEKEIEKKISSVRRASTVQLPQDFANLTAEDPEVINQELANGKKADQDGEALELEDIKPRRLSAISVAVPFKDEDAGKGASAHIDGGGDADRKPNAPKFEESLPPGEKGLKSGQEKRHGRRRHSTTRTRFRSMSALGTKAYAAPEIKHDLRTKTQYDIELSRQALTDCVADYGMIVDAYSVGWTLRVILTGIPPNVTISRYMKKISVAQEQVGETFCLCFKLKSPPPREIKVRDTSQIPKEATLLIAHLTKSNPDERMTVREAQNHPYIRGGTNGEEIFVFPEGDVPSKHGDPVVPLKCARAISTQALGVGKRAGK